MAASSLPKQPRVAIVHEWFAGYAGSERVVEQALHVWPDADLFALGDFLPDDQREFLGGRRPRTSILQKLPFARKRFRGYLPLMPWMIEQFDLDGYDLIFSSSHCVAHGVLTRADQLHVSYIHSPIRYAWDLHHQYLRESNLQWGVRSLIARGILHYMRLWDRCSADRVDLFLANSRYVAGRIQKTYRRDSEVVYPPVDVDQFALQANKENFFVTASRLVPYKRIDLIVSAFRHLPDQQLVVIGDGPEMKKLQSLAGPNVRLLGYQNSATMKSWMQRAKAFLFAADEDFGITPVEAQACGTPVIAYGKGGSRETVRDGITGILFDEQTETSLLTAIQQFIQEPDRFDPLNIRRHAEQFSVPVFRDRLRSIVANVRQT